jgi:thymidylate kinase
VPQSPSELSLRSPEEVPAGQISRAPTTFDETVEDPMDAFKINSRACLVSFSGIDGSGKSTQIEALSLRLKSEGMHVLILRFWDDVARLTRLREEAGHRIFKGDKGIGTPSAPITRRDKNVNSWFMGCVRLFIYFIDALSIRTAVKRALRSGADVVIFDRYTYDELANLTLRSPAVRAYVWLIMRITPVLHISYLLDADPIKAFARKPEYPLDFLYTNRQSYLDLADMSGRMTVIPPLPIPEVQRAILIHTLNTLAVRAHQPGNEVETPARGSGGGPSELEKTHIQQAGS